LKTAVRYTLEKVPSLDDEKPHIAASFQETVAHILASKVQLALDYSSLRTLVVAGGVASNQKIRTTLQSLCQDKKVQFIAPPIHLCTDNGAMIAWVGLENLRKGNVSSVDFMPRPRWPLGLC
jgi:N6-L-threonylcarbamoyladenine synthase